MPCALPPALPRRRAPATVLATARSPERNAGALAVTLRRSRLTRSRSGESALARVGPPQSATGAACAYELAARRRPLVARGPRTRSPRRRRSRRCRSSPASSPSSTSAPATPPSIDVTTAAHARARPPPAASPGPSPFLAIAGALLLIALERRPRRVGDAAPPPWRRYAGAPGRRGRRRGPARLVGALAGVLGRRLGGRAGSGCSRRSGGFSALLQRLRDESPDRLLARVGAALARPEHERAARAPRSRAPLPRGDVGALPLDPRTRHRSLPDRRAASRCGRSRAAFLAGALAWGMTLRPEPVDRAARDGCARRAPFASASARRPRPLALAAVLVPLAMTGAPRRARRARPTPRRRPRDRRLDPREPAAGIDARRVRRRALRRAPAFVGADLEQRRADAQAIADVRPSTAGATSSCATRPRRLPVRAPRSGARPSR